MSDHNLEESHNFFDENGEIFLKKIYQDFYPGLIVFASGYLKDVDLAEDTVEEIFIKLWNNRSTIYAIKNLRLYLYVAVKNSCINQLQKAKTKNVESLDYLGIDIEIKTATAEEKIISDEALKVINTEIKKLPKKCQAIFLLIKEEELKYSEVAQLLNLSIKTVEAQMAIAVKKLTTAMKKEFPEAFQNKQRRKSV